MKREQLEYRQMRPMYDKSIHRFLKSLINLEIDDEQALYERFKNKYRQWLINTQLNQISGLESFTSTDIIHGVTHALDDLHAVYGPKLVMLEHEYPYHLRIRPDMRVLPYHEWRTGDIAILSTPFCYTGNVHEDFDKIIAHCELHRIDLHIDAAWFGPCRNLHLDLTSPCIQTVAFSLSKGLGLGKYQIGVRLSRTRHIGPVSIVNDFGHLPTANIAIGENFITEFPIDYFQDKYAKAYQQIIKELDLIESSSLHIARKREDDGRIVPVGIRGLLREIVEGEFK